MVLVPVETPVTIPVDPTVAIVGDELDQVPPVAVFAKADVAPIHMVAEPVIVPASAELFTVMTRTATPVQPPLVTE